MSAAAPSALSPAAARALLEWYRDSGVITAEAAEETDFTQWPTRVQVRGASAAPTLIRTQTASSPGPEAVSDTASTSDAVAAATEAAQACVTLDALDAAIRAFDLCPLKAGARSTVVSDGVHSAPLLVIGEGPGREEDEQGRPFVGRAGQLLDRMLLAIGHSRQPGDGLKDVCITNAVYWRPERNRTPEADEVAICLPFVSRFIALSRPRAILLLGNTPTQALFPGAPGITRSRGQWREWPSGDGPIPVLPSFHPAFLLRSPAQKRLAWADLIALSEKL